MNLQRGNMNASPKNIGLGLLVLGLVYFSLLATNQMHLRLAEHPEVDARFTGVISADEHGHLIEVEMKSGERILADVGRSTLRMHGTPIGHRRFMRLLEPDDRLKIVGSVDGDQGRLIAHQVTH